MRTGIRVFLILLILSALAAGAVLVFSASPAPSPVLQEAAPSPSPAPTPSPCPSPAPAAVPEPTAEAPLLTFAVVGGSAGKGGSEPALCTESLQAALQQAKLHGAERVMLLGDLAAGSVFGEVAEQNLRAFLETASEFFSEHRLYPVFGIQESHHKGRNKIFAEEDDRSDPDLADMVEKDYKLAVFSAVFDEFEADSFCHKVYGRTVYAFTKNDCNFFVLNTKWYEHMDRVSPTVIRWMLDYADNGAAYNFIFLYGTPYPICETGMEMDADYSTTTDDQQTMTNAEFRDEFIAAVRKLKNPVLFCGSESMYARRTVNGLTQLNVSGMGYEFDRSVNAEEGILCGPVYENHCLVAQVYEDNVEFTVYHADSGEIIDRFTAKETD